MGKSRKQRLHKLSIRNGRLIVFGLFILAVVILPVIAGPAFSEKQTEETSKTSTGKAEELAPWPRLFVEVDFIDFGEVPFGKPLMHTFQLKNLGAQPLIIDGTPTVKTLEGC